MLYIMFLQTIYSIRGYSFDLKNQYNLSPPLFKLTSQYNILIEKELILFQKVYVFRLFLFRIPNHLIINIKEIPMDMETSFIFIYSLSLLLLTYGHLNVYSDLIYPYVPYSTLVLAFHVPSCLDDSF